jgi:hypothetical protein
MRNYYYLAISLPDLEIENNAKIQFKELMDLFNDNLSKKDLQSVDDIRLYFDLTNLESLLLEQPFDFRGKLTEVEIVESLKYQMYFPNYVFEFFDKFKDKDEQIKNFPSLFAKYFSDFHNESSDLKKLVIFERELRLALLGFRCIHFHRKIEEEFQHEDFTDETVQLTISDKAEPKVLDEIKLQKLFEKLKTATNALDVRACVETFRFEYYKEIQNQHPFTLVGIISYMMQLIIIENLEMKTPKGGVDILHYLLKDKNEHSE